MDNRLFDVNGKTKEMLLLAIDLALKQSNYGQVAGFKVTKQKGLILFWTDSDTNICPFPIGITAPTITEIAWEWLHKIEYEDFIFEQWEENLSHDGHNSKGWRVYCEGWGQIEGGDWQSFLAIKPAYLWHGK